MQHRITSHPLLFNEDNTIRDFIEIDCFIFARGDIIERNPITMSIYKLGIKLIKPNGRIFCQVMINKKVFIFMFSWDKIFMYHKWKGHAPIFIININIINIVFCGVGSTPITVTNIPIEVNNWIIK